MKKKYTNLKTVQLFIGIFILTLLNIVPTICYGTTIYVDASRANDNGDGLSWLNARKYLQSALALAVSGDEIWVATGVYYPDEGTNQTNNDQSATFSLIEGVKIYGGYPTGGGTRDYAINKTILSGDIDGNDTNTDANNIAESTTDIQGNNSYHVVTSDGSGSTNITVACELNGFYVTAGSATGAYPYYSGGGLYCNGDGTGNESSPAISNCSFSGNSASSDGGAIYNFSYNSGTSSPTLTNCSFSGNNASNVGGAIHNSASSGTSSPTLTNCSFSGNSAGSGGAIYNDAYSGTSSPTLTNCSFSGNSASSYGGAIYNYSDNGTSSPTLTNCSFSGNDSYIGGAIYNYAYQGTSSPTLTNCSFSGNSAIVYGGAIYNFSYNPGTSSPTLTNCSFSGNSASSKGGAIYNRASNSGTSSPTLTNCILWGNSATTSPEMYNSSASPTINYCDIAGSGGSGTTWVAAFGTDGGNNIDSDPLFASATTGDLSLNRFSPCMNTGDGVQGISVNNTTTDLVGNPRFYDNGIIDMGAYEYQGSGCPGGTILYVDKNVSGGNNDGTTWNNAFTNLQDALYMADNCTNFTEIQVATGVYYPDEGTNQSNNDQSATFSLIEGVKIYGGYPAGGGTRDWASHKTILSGDIEGNDTNTDANNIAESTTDIQGNNSYHVVTADGSGSTNITVACELNGFYVTAGSADYYGGGLYCNGTGTGHESSPAISNCSFSGNDSYKGGAIYNFSYSSGTSSPTLANCSFSGNSASSNGGAIYNNGYNGTSSPTLTNCSFLGNDASISGGAIYNYGYSGTSSPTLTNCSFMGNSADYGGAIYNYVYYGTSSPTLTNCILWGNSATTSGSEIYSISASPTISYCDIAGCGGSGTTWVAAFGTDGGNNIDVDPLFLDTTNGNLQLLPGSPCLNTGNNTANTEAFDIAGNDRIINTTIDMGAYERQQLIDVCGSISTNATWNADTVKVNCEITVEDDVTLTITPGTVVEFQGYYKLNVFGTLLAQGTVNDSIKFTVADTTGFYNNSHAGWQGIRINNAYSGANGAMNDNDSTILEYCRLEYGKGIGTGKSGGAFYISYFDKVRVNNSIIINNNADLGGGLSLVSSDAVLKKNQIIRNKAILFTGGGILISNGSSPILSDNTICFNTVPYDGGGVQIENSSPVLVNNLITNNTANQNGGGLAAVTYSYPELINNTIANNWAASKGGGISTNQGSAPTIKNTIIYNNFAPSNAQVNRYGNSGNLSIEYSNVEGGTNFGGSGQYTNNIDSDPLFVNPTTTAGVDGVPTSGDIDWSLSCASPCIDAGTPDTTGLGMPITDIAGNARIHNGTIDIGSYEAIVLLPPITQALNNQFSNVQATQMDITWTRGDGDSCAVFIYLGTTGTVAPECDVYYNANTTYSSGDQIGASGWYCVYRGIGTSATISGLSTGNTYRFHVCEFYYGSIAYNTTTATGNPANQATCSNPTDGGTIAANQAICFSTTPGGLTSSSAPSGHVGTLEYKWQMSTTSASSGFSDIASSNSDTYSPGGLIVSTWYKRLVRVDCSSDWSGAVESNVVAITVYNDFTAGAIETTSETICYDGDPSSIGSSTDASGGDETITYQWQSSTDNFATTPTDIGSSNSASYYPPANLTITTWYRRQAKDGTCNTSWETSSGVWKVTVYDNFTAGAISTTGETICYNGDPSSIGSSTDASGGDETITYQWQSSTDNFATTPTDIGSSNSASYDPPANLTLTTWYRRQAKDGTCNTSWETSTGVWKATVYDDFTAGAILTTGETICYGGDPALIGSSTAASGGDATISYKWESSTDGFATAGTEINGATAATYDPPSGLTTTTSYRRYAKDASCNTTFEVSTGTWVVTVYDDFTPGAIETTGETICYGGDPALIGSSTAASGGDETISYKWESSTDGFATAGTEINGATAATYDPPSGLTTTTSYRRYAHDGTCNTTFEVSTGTWVVTVYDEFTPGSIETTGETICYGDDPALIGSSTAASGGDATISYKWESSTDGFATAGTEINGATAATYDPPSGLTTTTSYRRYAHDGTCNTTFEVSTGTWVVTVYDEFTPGSIETTGETICYGDDPALIGSSTAASGGDETISYKWESSTDGFATAGTGINGATGASYDPPTGLTTTTSYRRYAKDAACNTTFEVSTGTWEVTVYDEFTPGAIATTGETICYGGDPALIGSSTAASGGDETISYKWESSTDGFATVGTEITGATASTYDPPSGLTTTTSYRRYAKDATCNTTFEVSTGTRVVTVYDEFNPGAIATTGETICYGGDPALIGSSTAASGGDGTITYKWESSTDGFATDGTEINGATAATYDPPSGLTTTTSYRRYAHDGTCNTTFEASTGTWVVTVYDEFTPGALATTGETICYGGDPALIGSSTAASGGDETISYKWESSTDGFATAGTGINGASGATYDPPSGLITTTSYRRYAKDASCNTTFEVSTGTWVVTVYDEFAPGAIESIGETICYGDDPALISGSVDARGGDEAISYQWQSSTDNFASTPTDIPGSNSASYDPPANLTETTWYHRQAVDGTCNTVWETSSGVWKVSVDPLPTAGILSNAPLCVGENLTLRGMYEPLLCESNCSLPQTYCASGSNLPFYEYISQVNLDDSINNSTFSGYDDQTSGLFHILYLDSTYALSVEINNYYNYLHYTNCFIDWNRDGDFDDPGEKTELGSGIGSQQLNGMITVPANAVLGQTMMRVVNRQNFDAQACGTYPIGETEDYLLEIRGMDTQSIISYAWSGPAGSSTAQNWTIAGVTPEESGSYNLTVTNTFNCTSVASVQADILNPQPNLGADTLYTMFPDTLQFDPGLFDSYQWNTGATTQQISGANYGTYKVTVSELQCSAEDSVWVGEIQNIGLREGWGIFSTYINTPLEMHELFADFATKPIIVKDDAGQVYWDFIDVDHIGLLQMNKGYMIKMANDDELIVYGDAYDETSPVSLAQGYNIASYLRKYPAPVDEIFSDVVNHLILVKDQDGVVYWPIFQVNMIGDMENGQGYIVKMNQADTLIYPSNSTMFAKSSIMIESPEYYSRARNTGENMTLGIPLEAWDVLPENGDEVAVLTKDGDLIGSAVFQGGHMAFPVWSKDFLDTQSKGLSEAEAFDLYIYHQASGEQEKLEVTEWLEGDGTYTRNGVAVVGKMISDAQPHDLSGMEAVAHPNPFRSELEIVITLPESSDISVSLYDVLGQKVEELYRGSYTKGTHQIRFDAARLTAGSYYLRVESNDESKLLKLTKID